MNGSFRHFGSRFGIFSSIIMINLCINSHVCAIHVGVKLFSSRSRLLLNRSQVLFYELLWHILYGVP